MLIPAWGDGALVTFLKVYETNDVIAVKKVESR